MQLDLPRGDALELSSHALPAFIAGPENALLIPPLQRLLADADLDELTRLFNPLVLVGPSGSGKTQLAQALVRKWRGVLQHCTASVPIEYFTAADFGREAQAAASEDRLSAWQKHIRTLRLLVVEDLQSVRPRGTIQQELRRAIDALLDSGGLVVVTAIREPVTLNQLDAGLRDRLAAGLTVRLQRPGLAARQAILRLAAFTRSLTLTEKQLHELSRREAASASELLGRLATLNPSGPLPLEGREGVAGRTHLDHEPESKCAQRAHAHHALKQILAVTARYFGITQAALTGPSRRTSLVTARNIVVHLARRFTDLSYAEIGRALGGRDHTTIMHADRRLAEQLASDPHTQRTIDELDRLLC
jgi:chromosomal replication initiator protein